MVVVSGGGGKWPLIALSPLVGDVKTLGSFNMYLSSTYINIGKWTYVNIGTSTYLNIISKITADPPKHLCAILNQKMQTTYHSSINESCFDRPGRPH